MERPEVMHEPGSLTGSAGTDGPRDQIEPSGQDLDLLLLRALDAAGAAASLLAVRPDRLRAASKSTATDAVTDQDLASEALLVRRLLAGDPDDAVLGEESGERAGTSPVRWVLDPLDGTVNYLYGVPQWSVSVAAEWDARVVVGVVVAPGIDRAWWAALGRGSWVGSWRAAVSEDDGYGPNGFGPWEPIHCAEPDGLPMALVGTGFGYDSDRRRAQGRVVAEVLPLVRDIRRTGAASVDLCSVAEGTLDAYYERGLQPWDHAAGALIAREAGGLCTGLRSGEPSEDFVVAGPPGLHAELRNLLIGLDADQG